MSSIFDQCRGIEIWSVNDDLVQEDLKKVFSVVKNPKLVKDQYERRKKGLEKFPPSSPPNTSPQRHPTDPFVFWVYTENGVTLKIQAYYRLWDETCFITKVTIADVQGA